MKKRATYCYTYIDDSTDLDDGSTLRFFDAEGEPIAINQVNAVRCIVLLAANITLFYRCTKHNSPNDQTYAKASPTYYLEHHLLEPPESYESFTEIDSSDTRIALIPRQLMTSICNVLKANGLTLSAVYCEADVIALSQASQLVATPWGQIDFRYRETPIVITHHNENWMSLSDLLASTEVKKQNSDYCKPPTLQTHVAALAKAISNHHEAINALPNQILKRNLLSRLSRDSLIICTTVLVATITYATWANHNQHTLKRQLTELKSQNHALFLQKFGETDHFEDLQKQAEALVRKKEATPTREHFTKLLSLTHDAAFQADDNSRWLSVSFNERTGLDLTLNSDNKDFFNAMRQNLQASEVSAALTSLIQEGESYVFRVQIRSTRHD